MLSANQIARLKFAACLLITACHTFPSGKERLAEIIKEMEGEPPPEQATRLAEEGITVEEFRDAVLVELREGYDKWEADNAAVAEMDAAAEASDPNRVG